MRFEVTKQFRNLRRQGKQVTIVISSTGAMGPISRSGYPEKCLCWGSSAYFSNSENFAGTMVTPVNKCPPVWLVARLCVCGFPHRQGPGCTEPQALGLGAWSWVRGKHQGECTWHEDPWANMARGTNLVYSGRIWVGGSKSTLGLTKVAKHLVGQEEVRGHKQITYLIEKYHE